MPGEAIFFIFVGSISAFTVLGIGLACFIYDGNQLFFNRMTEAQVANTTLARNLNAASNTEESNQPTVELFESEPPVQPIQDHRVTDPFSDEVTPKLNSKNRRVVW
ncbi:MAG: hypothetical protein U0930_02165 [Pirellulales bacterium]